MKHITQDELRKLINDYADARVAAELAGYKVEIRAIPPKHPAITNLRITSTALNDALGREEQQMQFVQLMDSDGETGFYVFATKREKDAALRVHGRLDSDWEVINHGPLTVATVESFAKDMVNA